MPLAVPGAGDSNVVLIVERSNRTGKEMPMGNLSDQMEALVEGILTATRGRESAVDAINAGTERMLSAFSGERRASATRVRSELSTNCRARAVEVRKMRQGFHRDQDRLAKKQRDELAAGCRTRSQTVARLMDDFKMSRGEMAQELTESLQKFAQRVQSQVSSLRQGFRASFQEVREDVQAAHQIWNNLLLVQAGLAAPMATPAGGFEMGEAEEKVTVGDAIRRFVTKRGKPKLKRRH